MSNELLPLMRGSDVDVLLLACAFCTLQTDDLLLPLRMCV